MRPCYWFIINGFPLDSNNGVSEVEDNEMRGATPSIVATHESTLPLTSRNIYEFPSYLDINKLASACILAIQ